MRAAKLASRIHKWLALIIGVQILLWFASGWFISFFPIERVRGEHLARDVAPALLGPVPGNRLAAVLTAAGPASRIEVRRLLGRTVVQVDSPAARPRLFDLASGRRLSPLPAATAAVIARAEYAGNARVAAVTRVDTPSPQYRGPLPAWRVRFADAENSASYVAADTGRVLARRTDLWRLYDLLWGLHIMDWRSHEDINHWWLWASAALGLVIVVTGAVMMPSRFKWRRRRRIVPPPT